MKPILGCYKKTNVKPTVGEDDWMIADSGHMIMEPHHATTYSKEKLCTSRCNFKPITSTAEVNTTPPICHMSGEPLLKAFMDSRLPQKITAECHKALIIHWVKIV